MKTEISRFCDDCLKILESLPPALDAAAEHFEQSGDPALFRLPLTKLNDVRARLRSLVEKLSSQQAYLLIFGPLKSGKSTLMNAISGAYVSEVTSLPGYPCLVFVRNAESPQFSATRYNGRESIFANGRALKEVIADSHYALARQIREAEDRGIAFDPRTHFSEAIRRVDVNLPIPTLAESGTVLVDTPGLYSRMNFGYDVMTREFRDSAACAVFVVKTDNLFFEQVFAEFNQLLDIFSRIFIVINVDSSKRDLLPDGALRPSAESSQPDRVVEAFKTLSMAGALRKAYEEKRVRLHAVDLLSAASALLSQNGHRSVEGSPQREAFDGFLRDLTEYLNSTDYAAEFIRDSLRQGHTLCAEARNIFEGDEISRVHKAQTELEKQLRDFDDRIKTVDRLLQADWGSAFELARADADRHGKESIPARAVLLWREMRGALERWYAGNDSLRALVEDDWNPLLIGAGRELAAEAAAQLRSAVATPLGGAEPAAAVMSDLHAVGFSFQTAAQAAISSLDADEVEEPYRATITADAIPVRKSLLDAIFFRSRVAVRNRLFGEQLNREIASGAKQKRLPETSREAILGQMEEIVRQKFPALPASYCERLLTAYVTKFQTAVQEGLRQLRDQFARDRSDCLIPFETNKQILASAQELHEQATSVACALDQIAGAFNTDPEPAADGPPESAHLAPVSPAPTLN
jgi:energy-coupling factor transporter ATP-binding protein EcfA2